MTAKKLLKLAEQHWQDDSFDEWKINTELMIRDVAMQMEYNCDNRKLKRELSDLSDVMSLIKIMTLQRTFIYDQTRREEQRLEALRRTK